MHTYMRKGMLRVFGCTATDRRSIIETAAVSRRSEPEWSEKVSANTLHAVTGHSATVSAKHYRLEARTVPDLVSDLITTPPYSDESPPKKRRLE